MGPEPLEVKEAREQMLRHLAHPQPQVPVPHCAECCTDDSCPRCWVASATVELELVPLPRA